MSEEYVVQATFTGDDSSYVSAAEQVVAANEEVAASAAALEGAMAETGANMGSAVAEGATEATGSLQAAGGAMEEVGAAAKEASGGVAESAGGMTVMEGAMGKVGGAASGASDGLDALSESGAMAAAEAGVSATGFAEASDVMETSVASAGEKSGQSFLQMAWGFGQTVQQAVFMASAFVMLGKIVVDVVGGMIQSSESAKQTAADYTTLTGSSSAAAEALGQFDTIAKNTSFPTKDMEAAGATLMSMGVDSSKAGDELQTVAMGLQEVGKSSGSALAPAAKALETLREQSKVTVSSMDQLVDKGLPAWQALASGMGVSVDTAMARVKSGAVTGQEAFDDISKGVQNMSSNASGGFSSLQSHWNTFTNTFSASSAPVNSALDNIAIGAVDMGTNLVQAGVGFGTLLSMGAPVAGALMSNATAMSAAGAASQDAGSSMQTASTSLESAGSAAGSASEPIEKYSSSLQGLGGDLSEVSSTADTYGSSVKQAASTSSQAGSNIGALGGILGGIASAFSSAAAAAGQFMSSLGNASNAQTGSYSNPAFPGFASGVRNFSGGLAWVGEAGPELVALPSGSSVYPMNDVSGMGFSPLPDISGLSGLVSGFGGPMTFQLIVDSTLLAQAIIPQIAPTMRLAIGARH